MQNYLKNNENKAWLIIKRSCIEMITKLVKLLEKNKEKILLTILIILNIINILNNIDRN